jgi:hypothetical protein
MADNVTVSNGSLAAIPTATNEVGLIHFPKVKLADPRAGQVGAFGVPGNPISFVHDGTPDLPADAATETTLADVVAALRGPQTGTLTKPSIVSTAGGSTVLAANSLRRGYQIWNVGSATVYILHTSGTPSATDFSETIDPGNFIAGGLGSHRGIIKGIAASGTVTLNVTEFTP